MKTSYALHSYVNKYNEQQIILDVAINGIRKKIPTGYFTKAIDWDAKNQRSKKNNDLNLVLENDLAKATEIRTFFRLNRNELSMDAFLSEFYKKTPSYDFFSFFENEMFKRITNANTLKKHKSVLKKLRDYYGSLPFTSINISLFAEYRNHLYQLGNNKSTRNSNIKIIKYYLLYATKMGIILNVSLSDIEVGSCSGNRTSLSVQDTKRLYQIYFLNVLSENEQLSLGYFLIACMTSLRVSDILLTKRKEILSGEIFFSAVKTQKNTTLKIIPEAIKLIEHNPLLFSKKISQQKINQHLKDIAKNYKINKRVTMHIGRHTFATNYIKAGGTVQDLQIILGHSNIETTMIYVHMDKEEALNTVNILSGMFSS